MSLFFQVHHNTLDEKGRVFMPASFRRDALPEILAGEFVVTPDRRGFLVVRPRVVWDEYIETIKRTPGVSRGEKDDYLALLYGLAQSASIDRQNRMVFSQQTRKALGVPVDEGKMELVLQGAGDHFRVWRAEQFEGEEALLDRAASLQERFDAVVDRGQE